ncbi:MAG: lipid II:glycine glycyltransferase FemX [Patescibacteria group bacterium]
MEIRIIEDKQFWEMAIQNFEEANFLQSFNWGLFHRAMDKKVFPLALFEGEKILALFLTVKEIAKRGNYLTIAGGPLLDWHSSNAKQYLKVIFDHLKKIAKDEKCSFIRFRPQTVLSNQTVELLRAVQAQPAPMHLTADLTLQLNLNLSEDELLAQMRKNTRYEIRRAQKMGITTHLSQDAADLEKFNELQQYLAKKHNFIPFSNKFISEQFKVFAADDQVVLVHSEYQGQLLASAFVIFYHGEAVYHYGVSTPQNDRLPGSYACQWAAILEAKRRGCQKYNFWGIAPKDEVSHRFYGVSIFKRGFGGEEVQYIPAEDVAVDFKYQFTRAFELVRKKTRRL